MKYDMTLYRPGQMLANCLQALKDLGWVDNETKRLSKSEIEAIVAMHVASADIDDLSDAVPAKTLSSQPGTAITVLCIARMELRAKSEGYTKGAFLRDGYDREFGQTFFRKRYVQRALNDNGTSHRNLAHLLGAGGRKLRVQHIIALSA